jgi:hypothetical protein
MCGGSSDDLTDYTSGNIWYLTENMLLQKLYVLIFSGIVVLMEPVHKS